MTWNQTCSHWTSSIIISSMLCTIIVDTCCYKFSARNIACTFCGTFFWIRYAFTSKKSFLINKWMIMIIIDLKIINKIYRHIATGAAFLRWFAFISRILNRSNRRTTWISVLAYCQFKASCIFYTEILNIRYKQIHSTNMIYANRLVRKL